MSKSTRNIGFILYVVVISLLPFAVFEITCAVLMEKPEMTKKVPWSITRIVWTVSRRDWQAIQFNDRCAQYDRELFYTLKPGRCEYSRYGFFKNTKYSVNSKGLRDDEASLEKPEIVVVGDSYAMGWGIEQEETFAQQIEKMTGLKTLNAGISSYGTVREMKMLDRIDTSAMRYLIIQHHPNDLEENKAFYEKGELVPSSEKTYRDSCETQKRTIRYFPGRYATLSLSFMIQELKDKMHPSPAPPHSEADYFLNAFLRAGSKDLKGVEIFVIGKKAFCDDLRNKIAAPGIPEVAAKIHILDIFSRINEDMEIPIDFHWNAKGHLFAAEELVKALF